MCVIRNARLLKYLAEIKSANYVGMTIKYLYKPIVLKLLFLYLVFYVFAYAGMIIFNGDITMAEYQSSLRSYPIYYYTLNFNDFNSSMVVLFQQMIVNNWFVVVDMLADAHGDKIFVRAFFTCFWMIVVLILLNIFVAIVLEVYGSVVYEADEKFKKLETR